MRQVTVIGERVLSPAEADAVRGEISRAFRERQSVNRLHRLTERNHATPERLSVAKAMLAVEDRMVRAFWTIARQPAKNLGPMLNGRCGLDYLPERGDLNGYADAAGGSRRRMMADWRLTWANRIIDQHDRVMRRLQSASFTHRNGANSGQRNFEDVVLEERQRRQHAAGG